MQWIKWALMAAAGCVATAVPVMAEEPATPNKRPQEIQLQVDDLQIGPRAMQLAFDRMKREKGSYLGVSAAPPPTVLRKQLGLTPGMGLIVEFVVPDSPAAKAGVQQYDVLQKLDDQLIVNREQLTVLVRSHKPGDEIKLGIIHDGKPATLAAKLIEHDVEPLAVDGEWEFQLEHVFPEPRVTLIAPGQHPPIVGWSNFSGTIKGGPSSLTLLDGDRSYSITTIQGGQQVFTVKGKDGKIIFEGPINSKEDRQKVPAELKEKLEKLQKGPLGSIMTNPSGAKPATQPINIIRKKNAD